METVSNIGGLAVSREKEEGQHELAITLLFHFLCLHVSHIIGSVGIKFVVLSVFEKTFVNGNFA